MEVTVGAVWQQHLHHLEEEGDKIVPALILVEILQVIIREWIEQIF
jgi:hypothetical protein